MSKVTLDDIAKGAGVHRTTASRALNPAKANLVNSQTRARVQRVAAELGYLPDAVATGLRSGKTGTLGVIVADLANPFLAPIVRGIENNLESRGMMALVAETQDDHARFYRAIDHLMSRRVDAIVTTAARLGDEPAINKVVREIPVVLAVRKLTGTSVPFVAHDDERGGRMAADHLMDLGFSRLGHIRGPSDISSFSGRSAGFTSRVVERSGMVVEAPLEASHPTFEEGKRVMKAMIEDVKTLPDAFFIQNDTMAVGGLSVLRRNGLRCPNDVRVIGYNDVPLSGFLEPPLSTVRFPSYEVGRMAADMAVMHIEDPYRRPAPIALPPELVARASTLGTEQDRTTK